MRWLALVVLFCAGCASAPPGHSLKPTQAECVARGGVWRVTSDYSICTK